MHKGFFADTLALRPPLFRAMLDANRLPGDWPGGTLSSAADRLASTLWADAPRARRFLRPLLTPRPLFWDFAEETRRLALLPSAELLRLGRMFGVAVHAPAMARVIARSEVLALRDALGGDLYRYALYRGQYQLGDVRRLFAARDDDLALPERARLHGRQALAACAASWPDALRARVADALRLSETGAGFSDPARLSAAPDFLTEHPQALRAVWFGLKKILLREVAPSWAPCFD